MQYSEEWKSLFPIASMHSAPLLLQNSPSLGPLLFNPVPESLSLLFSSSNLAPPTLLPPPHVSLPSFIQSAIPSNSSAILASTASAIAVSISHKDHCNNIDFFLRNRLEPLHCPNNRVFIFYPTGHNLDSFGFVVLSVRDSKLDVEFNSDGSIIAPRFKNDHRIIQLAACPVSEGSFPNEGGLACVGFLVACSMYSANWFSVQISGHCLASKKPALVFLGSKRFTSAVVAHACWNPHLPGECVILLANGTLFLFEMDPCLDRHFGGKRISVSWHEMDESKDSRWLSCEFSWHPRILFVANSKAIHLVDMRFGKCQPSCLLSIDILGISELPEKDKFLVFSKAGSDGFLYTVASMKWLFLCDVRKPLAPVLRWAHHLHKPRYMTVLPLSDLRSIPHDKHAEASAIILGSFWNNEFNLFCYGRPQSVDTNSVSRSISNLSYSFYAWELPSLFLLGRQSCLCGSCLIRQRFVNEDLLAWLGWQQKQDIVLGFCILSKGLSSLLPEAGEHGGFMVVRLMSTGKLESQQFCASWKSAAVVATRHGEMNPLKDSPLCSLGDAEYEYTRVFRYLKLESLYNHLNNDLSKVLFKKFRDISVFTGVKNCSTEHFHKFMRENFTKCDLPLSHHSLAEILRDTGLPTSLYEIVGGVMWTSLPMNISEMAFLDHSVVLEVYQREIVLYFPAILDQNHCPPFYLRNPAHRSIKCSQKLQSNKNIVGPVGPLSPLVVFNEISRHGYSFVDRVSEFSPGDIYAQQCKSVMDLIKEMCNHNIGDKLDKKHAVSLKEDRDETWVQSSKTRSLFLYKPSAFLDEVQESESSALEQSFDTVVAKLAEDDDDIFAGLCPMELIFDSGNNTLESSTKESAGLKVLKKQFSRWQSGFMPYQNLQTQLREKQPPL